MKKATKIQIICVILILVAFWLFTSCKTKMQYVPIESVKIEYRDKIQRDSIHLYDSIYFEKYLKGDTVFLTKEKYKYLYRDKIVRDSIFKSDTIRVPYPVKGDTIEVNKLNWYQEACIWFTSIVLIALALYLGIRYRSIIFSFLKKLIFKI